MSVVARTRQRRVLLAIDHTRNREVLEDWLARHDTLGAADDEEFDIAVFDGPAFARRRDWLRELRSNQHPAYVPCLLITPHRDVSILADDLWRDVDDLITTPVRADELRVRLERLLQVRERSLQTLRSNADLQQFAYVAAHELSTPLMVVTGVLETVLARYREGLASDVENLLTAARSSSYRLRNLIDDLLAYSRANHETVHQPVELDEVLVEALSQLEAEIEHSGADVSSEGLPVVLGDPQQLRLVFGNLVGNAIKYRDAARTPEIRLAAERIEDAWCISVEDNGIGIEPERAQAVFAMFERNHPSSDRPGSGIGLALCKRIVERHGGEIWIETAESGGTLVKLSLPPA